MKIELRNVKYSAFASQETSCFEAAVWVDGVKAGMAENDGHGGATFIHPRELEEKLNAYAATLPPVVTEFDDPRDRSQKFCYKPTGETVIGDLLNDYLLQRDLRRALSKRLLWTREGKVYQSKTLTPQEKANYLRDVEATKAHVKADAILNVLPEAEALAIYRRA